MRGLAVLVLVVVLSAAGEAGAARPVTVFLERHGKVVSDRVTIPAYGGGEQRWRQLVRCVADHFAPFQVEVTDRRPRGEAITAVIGGWASQLGLSNATTNGVGPYRGSVIRNATVFVFAKVGTGERDVENLCAVTAHEVAHAMGLDHTYRCGDLMSYFGDRCGRRRFLDVESYCGEDEARMCGDGEPTQSSYRKLGELVGFRAVEDEEEPEDDEEDEGDVEDEIEDEDAGEVDDEVDVSPPHGSCGRVQYRVIYRVVRRR